MNKDQAANWKAVAETIDIDRALMRDKLDRYEAALEHIARADLGLTGEEHSAKLIGIIFDLQNHASATLAGVEPVTGDDMAKILLSVR